jgi:hypothetical protein
MGSRIEGSDGEEMNATNEYSAKLELFACDTSIPNVVKENTKYPSWATVERMLDEAYSDGGLVRLENPEIESELVSCLSMEANPGKFRLIVLVREGGDPRATWWQWWEPGDGPERGRIQGLYEDYWDARTFCTDLSVAKGMFREFFDRNDLSKENLSQMRPRRWSPSKQEI